MSEYSELIKRFDKIRDYMRDFYVFGFQSRNQLSGKPGKSGRSYDNERRRIESYLSDFMSFRQDKNGKSIFLSVDSSSIPENPLYLAFKSKTFTKNDIMLHFSILDLLADGEGRSAGEIAEAIDENYLSSFDNPTVLDVSTIRKKLIEYEKLGLLRAVKDGKTQRYFLNLSEEERSGGSEMNISREALLFFSEVSPLGVVGSCLMDLKEMQNEIFSWKHHYIVAALDSEICCELVSAMHEKRKVEIVNESSRAGQSVAIEILPLKILVSVQNGRRYVAAYQFRRKAILSFRLDYIKSVKLLEECPEFERYREKAEILLTQCWGVSLSGRRQPEHLIMELRIGEKEEYMVSRVEREGRHGTMQKIDDSLWRYEIDVWDAMEMLPWLRTFTGRVLSLSCTNPAVTKTFYGDLDHLFQQYGLSEGRGLNEGHAGTEETKAGNAGEKGTERGEAI